MMQTAVEIFRRRFFLAGKKHQIPSSNSQRNSKPQSLNKDSLHQFWVKEYCCLL
jgi:hypothetical protein